MAGEWGLPEVNAQIDLVNTAISDILTHGVSQAMRGRSLSRENLKELREHLAWLQGEKARLEGGSGVRRWRGVSRR